MPLTEVDVCTPNYVLMDENRRISPKLTERHSDHTCSAIYGFSDKGHYDSFAFLSDLQLTPYPLVKGYLRNQVDWADGSLKLVVVDAAGLDEPNLHAATMEAVLEAQENKASQIIASYRLAFDPKLDAYTVAMAAIGSDAITR